MGHPLKYKPVIVNHVLVLQKPFSFQGTFYLLYLYSIFNQNIYTYTFILLERHLDKQILFSHTFNSCINSPNQIDVSKQNNRLLMTVTILSMDTLTGHL